MVVISSLVLNSTINKKEVNKLDCHCGGKIIKKKKNLKWNNHSKFYKILNVPYFNCNNNCGNSFYHSDDNFNLLILTEEMEKGTIFKTIDYTIIEKNNYKYK